jgi:hypothetical protein
LQYNISEIMDQQLISLITQTAFISPQDKDFLIEKLSGMSPLEKLRLRGALLSGQAPEILQSLQIMRAKFFAKETPKKPDLIEQISNKISGNKAPSVVAHSVLTQAAVLGSNAPQPVRGEQVKPLNNIQEFYHPGQLSMLNSNHITFGLNINNEQVMQSFLSKLTSVFESIENVNIKRSYFMNWVESPLFTSYINTTLTALRHPELQPAKIILNLLYQINNQYLNNKQFQFAAVISNHVRNLAGV